jgi:hypothetical protein
MTLEKILEKLEAGESLSTKDFEVLEYDFEYFLRYCQVSDGKQKEFHEKVKQMINHKIKKDENRTKNV